MSTGSSTPASTDSNDPAIAAIPSGCSVSPNVLPVAVGAAARIPESTSTVIPEACSWGADSTDQAERLEQRVALERAVPGIAGLRGACRSEWWILHDGGDDQVGMLLGQRRRSRSSE